MRTAPFKYLIAAIALGIASEAFPAPARPTPPMHPSRPATSKVYPSQGEVPVAVLLVQYRDVRFSHPMPLTYFSGLLSDDSFSEYGAAGSVSAYFSEQSEGKFVPKFSVFGPVTLPQNRSYYGTNTSSGADKSAEDMIVHAAPLLESTIDFSRFDLDGDGTADNLIVVYAGQGEASYGPASSVWPHSGSLEAKKKTAEIGGVRIDRYSCINEWEYDKPAGTGVFVYELATLLGLPELGHSSMDGMAFTPDVWSVMDAGWSLDDSRMPPNMSVFERYYLGWTEPKVLDAPETVTIPAGSREGYMIRTERDNEYFLLENRQQTGRDASLPSHGLLVWHIHHDPAVFAQNTVNDLATHQYVDLVEAGGVANSHNDECLASYPWPGPLGRTEFSAGTTPALVSWGGRPIDLPLTEIAEDSEGNISFKVAGGRVELGVPEQLLASLGDASSVRVSWHAVENATAYLVDVYSRISEGEPDEFFYRDFSCAQPSLTLTDLPTGIDLYLTVRATLGRNTGPASAELAFRIPAPDWADIVPDVEDTAMLDDNGAFTARWKAVEGAVDYHLSIEALRGARYLHELNFGHSATTELSLPEGWSWSGTARDLYMVNSTGFYGDTAPALKFNSDAVLETPLFGDRIIRLSFWQRGASEQPADILSVEVSDVAGRDWTTVYRTSPCAQEGGMTVTLSDFPESARRIRFVYTKISGNMALDDIAITLFSGHTEALDDWSDVSVGDVQEYFVQLPEPYAHAYYYKVQAFDNSGNPTRLSRPGIAEVPEWLDVPDIPAYFDNPVVSGSGVKYSGRDGDVLSVYSLTGMLVGQSVVDRSGSARVSVAVPGMYIVLYPGGARKVLVR